MPCWLKHKPWAPMRAWRAPTGELRAEVEINLRKISQLVDEVNRKLPFARDAELKLP